MLAKNKKKRFNEGFLWSRNFPFTVGSELLRTFFGAGRWDEKVSRIHVLPKILAVFKLA